MAKQKTGYLKMNVEITFIEGVLGTMPRDPLVAEKFLTTETGGAFPDDQAAALGVAIKDQGDDDLKGPPPTIFCRNTEGQLILWDYQIKGFLKDALGAFYRMEGKAFSAYKKIVDSLIFVAPRQIPLILPEGKEPGWCERSIRVGGPKGERVALALSEEAPKGTKFECTFTCLRDDLLNWVERCLDYGEVRGIGQWRNSGKGRLSWRDLG